MCRPSWPKWTAPLWAVVYLRVAAAKDIQFKLGGAIALSGSQSNDGMQCQMGWTLWASRFNELGGVTLSNGDRVTVKMPLDLRDDGSNKANSMELLRGMLNVTSPEYADLDFVIGPFTSGLTQGNALVAKEFKKIIFSHGASESLYNRNNTYIFSALTPGGNYMSSGLELLWRKGVKTVAFMFEIKSFSRSVCSGGMAKAEELGYQVAGVFDYLPTETNFAGIVSEMKVFDPDVIVACGHFDDIYYLVGQMVLLEVNPRAFLVTHAADSRVIKQNGPKALDTMSPTQWDRGMVASDTDGFFGNAQDFYKLFFETYAAEPAYQAAYAGAMGYSLGKAIELADAIDTEKVREALYAMEIDSFYGVINYSDAGDPSGLVGTMPRRSMVTTQVQLRPGGDYGEMQIGVVAPVEMQSLELSYPARMWFQKDLDGNICPLGAEETRTGGCRACSPGFYRDKSVLYCSPCPPGTATPANGSTKCEMCAKGTIADQIQQSQCKTCPAGYHAVEKGSSACAACRPGSFKASEGVEECERCPEGSYADGTNSTTCIPCPDGKVTKGRATISLAECTCAEGFFYKPNARCTECPKGLNCPGGNDPPSQMNGFYVEVKNVTSREYEVYECVDASHCPGGAFSKCEAPYAGRSCAVCGEDEYNPTHECGQCPWYTVVCMVLGLHIFCIVVCVNTDRRKYGSVNGLNVVSQNVIIAIAAMQNLNLIITSRSSSRSGPDWIVQITEISMLKLEMLDRSCTFGVSFRSRLLFASMPPVAVCIAMATCYAVSKAVANVSNRAFSLDAILNATGTLFVALFVTLCKNALGCFVVQGNPGAPDTLVQYPDVLIGGDVYFEGLWLSIITTLVYVIGVFCFFLTAVVKAPTLRSNSSYRRRYRFLFAPWRPQMWFWSLMVLARNILMNLVPILLPNSPIWRAALFMLILSTYVCLLGSFAPWLMALNNITEMVSLSCLVIATIGILASTADASAVVTLMFVFLLAWAVVGCVFFALGEKITYFRNRQDQHRQALMAELFTVAAKLSYILRATRLSNFEEEYSRYLQLTVSNFSSFDKRAMMQALDIVVDHLIVGKRSSARHFSEQLHTSIELEGVLSRRTTEAETIDDYFSETEV